MLSQWAPANFPEKKISLMMHVAGLFPCVYFSVHHIFYNNFLFGIIILPCMSTLLASVYLMLTRPNSQDYKVADFWFLLLAIPPVLLALILPEMHGEFFVPPLILACFVRLPLKLAERLVMALSLAAIGLSFQHLGSHIAQRFSLSVIVSHFFAWGLARLLMKQNTELKELAFKDTLTRCYNRRALYEELLVAKQHYKHNNVVSSIIMLDIDFFKQVNDQHGHNVGDKVLVWFATYLQNNVRVSDQVFRFGGEEFLILLPNTDFSQAYHVSEQLLQQLAQPSAPPNQQTISFSAGVASVIASESIDDWLERADQAMYLAKQAGRKHTWPRHIKTPNETKPFTECSTIKTI
ncbi:MULTISPECIES: GGDEF domain-containing protein [unclassified Agarivorans]|uniref:GGDEF domain-containing protein n=1 Tax=unclassified Agarivorans TaxID=2636026 RepID=UPI003D7E3BC4